MAAAVAAGGSSSRQQQRQQRRRCVTLRSRSRLRSQLFFFLRSRSRDRDLDLPPARKAPVSAGRRHGGAAGGRARPAAEAHRERERRRSRPRERERERERRWRGGDIDWLRAATPLPRGAARSAKPARQRTVYSLFLRGSRRLYGTGWLYAQVRPRNRRRAERLAADRQGLADWRGASARGGARTGPRRPSCRPGRGGSSPSRPGTPARSGPAACPAAAPASAPRPPARPPARPQPWEGRRGAVEMVAVHASTPRHLKRKPGRRARTRSCSSRRRRRHAGGRRRKSRRRRRRACRRRGPCCAAAPG